jgi:hypothetical protein
MDRATAISAFLEECYAPVHASSFVCFAEPGRQRFETHTRKATRATPFADGLKRAHVFSVTKSMIGLFWAQMVHNYDGRHGYLYGWLGSAEDGAMGNFLDARNPVRIIENVARRPLHRFLTMTSGVATGPTNALYIAQVRTLHHGTFARSPLLTTFGSVVYDGYYDRGAPPEGEWRYSDACMQIATEAAEEFERAMTLNDALTARDVVVSRYFPAWLHEYFRANWPMLNPGYVTVDETGVIHDVLNTVGFYGLQMTGMEMRDVGVHLLTHHLPLLQRIYAEKTIAEGGYAVTLTEQDEPDRHGWRYWCFWWMPICLPDDPCTDCARGQWMSAIGHMGQYILLELTARRVFIRQHFFDDALFENVDLASIDPAKARRVRMPEFVSAAQRLHRRLEAVAGATASPVLGPPRGDKGQEEGAVVVTQGIGKPMRRAK